MWWALRRLADSTCGGKNTHTHTHCTWRRTALRGGGKLHRGKWGSDGWERKDIWDVEVRGVSQKKKISLMGSIRGKKKQQWVQDGGSAAWASSRGGCSVPAGPLLLPLSLLPPSSERSSLTLPLGLFTVDMVLFFFLLLLFSSTR